MEKVISCEALTSVIMEAKMLHAQPSASWRPGGFAMSLSTSLKSPKPEAPMFEGREMEPQLQRREGAFLFYEPFKGLDDVRAGEGYLLY